MLLQRYLRQHIGRFKPPAESRQSVHQADTGCTAVWPAYCSLHCSGIVYSRNHRGVLQGDPNPGAIAEIVFSVGLHGETNFNETAFKVRLG